MKLEERVFCVGDIINVIPAPEGRHSYSLIVGIKTKGWIVSHNTELYQEFHIARLAGDCDWLSTYSNDACFVFVRTVNRDDKIELLLHPLKHVRQFATTL